MNKYYFTFGFRHYLKNGINAAKYYTSIIAENETEARKIMYNVYKDKWAFCYLEKDKERCIDEYHITYVPFGT